MSGKSSSLVPSRRRTHYTDFDLADSLEFLLSSQTTNVFAAAERAHAIAANTPIRKEVWPDDEA